MTDTSVRAGGARVHDLRTTQVMQLRRHVGRWSGHLYLLPALAFYVIFIVGPIAETLWTSLFEWDGITAARWVGLDNYAGSFTNPETGHSLARAGVFVIFYAVLPIVIGLAITGMVMRVRVRLLPMFRTILFLPQVLSTVVIAVAWRWIYAEDGPLNALLSMVGLSSITRAWLGDFDTALPAVGLVGTWAGYGLCMLLFIGGVQKIPRELYEAARIDGAGPVAEFFVVTLPALRGEIGVALILTVTNALRNFDVVWNTTRGGPGTTTTVPSYLIYEGAFVTHDVGLAAARAVMLTALILLVVGLINRFVAGDDT